MTDDEYATFSATMWEDYAQTRARNSGAPIEEERATSAQQRDQLLPNGLHTPDQLFWQVVTPDGASVGVLWVHVEPAKRQAFIYQIEMAPDQRGKGYGQATLEALEATLKPLGIANIGLNVFGDNTVAMRLYTKLGYQVVATNMRKPLT